MFKVVLGELTPPSSSSAATAAYNRESPAVPGMSVKIGLPIFYGTNADMSERIRLRDFVRNPSPESASEYGI